MRHLRNSGIEINGSNQKRRLKNIGYYHGYKGYRFARQASNRLTLTNFSQVAALYGFDTQLKALFYSRVMFIETAFKNYTLEAVLEDADSEVFEDVWRKSLTDYRSHSGKGYREAWETRQRLRREIDSIIYVHRGRDVIGHFRDADKDFRNVIAHNGVVLDVRFQTGGISTVLTQLIKQETSVSAVDFADITDYVVLLVYLMRRMGFTKTECRQFITDMSRAVSRAIIGQAPLV